MSESGDGKDSAAAAAERRRPRKRAQLRGLAVLHDGTGTVDCRIEDVSETGARISVNKGRAIPQNLYLIVAGKETAHDAIVVWTKGQEIGLNFVKTLQLESVKNTELQFLRRLKLERLRS